MRRAFLALAFSLLLAGCLSSSNPSFEGGRHDFFLTTSDGWGISAFEVEPSQSNGVAFVLLHELSGSKEDYKNFAFTAAEKGFHVVAIDLRGHGKSNLPLSFDFFSTSDFSKMPLDARAAVDYAFSTGDKQVVLIGASIGANAALQEAADDARVKKIVLLSPGLNYRGLEAGVATKSFEGSALLIASKGDSYSHQSAKRLAELSSNYVFLEYDGSLHGTALLPLSTQKILQYAAG